MEILLEPYPSVLNGNTVPVIFDYVKNRIAQPNTSLSAKGEVKWECADWMNFHKGLVRFFMEGRFKSRAKYPKAEATNKANEVFMQHWQRNAGFFSSLRNCGYTSEFFTYFKAVGLTDVLSILQAVIVPTAKTVTDVTETVSTTVSKTSDAAGKAIVNAGDTIANTTGLAKYLIPIALSAVALGTGIYIYKNYVKGDKQVSIGLTKF